MVSDTATAASERETPSEEVSTTGASVVRGRYAEVHLSEFVVGSLTVLVTLLAWAALALAHVGAFSLPLVLVVTAIAAALVVAVVTKLAPLRVKADPAACIGVVALTVLAAVMFLPGFAYGVTDKDPGGYTEQAFSIARTGSYKVQDPTLDGRIPGGPVLEGPGARFGSLWLQKPGSNVIVPQFYHLWPALLAVADDAAGQRGLAQVAPILGILAVLMAALALRRAVGGARSGLR